MHVYMYAFCQENHQKTENELLFPNIFLKVNHGMIQHRFSSHSLVNLLKNGK